MIYLSQASKRIELAVFILLLSIVAGLVYWLYEPGLTGSLHFDDEVNLRGLTSVTDLQSALQFSLSGWNAAFGRFISLASFALQARDWGVNLERMLWVNVLIHCVNVILVGLLAFALARAHDALSGRAVWIAVFAALFWGLSPLHVPATLMLVQRMTTLAATFQLIALLAYVTGRVLYIRSPFAARILVFFVVPVFTLIAAGAKEQGVLVPLYCLVLEVSWFWKTYALRANIDKFALRSFLAIPLLFIIGYLVWTAANAEQFYARRDFTLSERLMTQSRILLEYLHGLFLPRSGSFSPFHDDFMISRGLLDPWQTLPALMFWPVAFIASWRLRQLSPWPFFALSWFLVGHSIESTVIPLELYFEHRNYLPVFGPVFAVVALAVSLQSKPHRRLAASLGSTYLALVATVLWSTTSLWGNPLLASAVWLDLHPRSERAVLYAAQRVVLEGDSWGAYKILRRGAEESPSNLGLTMSSLQFACLSKRSSEVDLALKSVFKALPVAPYSNAANEVLGKIVSYYIDDACPGLEFEDVWRIIAEIQENRQFANNWLSRSHVMHNKARLHAHLGQMEDAIVALEASLKAYPIVTSLIDLANLKAKLSGVDAAIDILSQWRNRAPSRGVASQEWIKAIDLQIEKFKMVRAIERDIGRSSEAKD